MTTSVLLTLSIALISGLLLSRLAKKVGLPAVTAYLVAGVLIGPFLLGQLGIGFNSTDNSPEHYKILCAPLRRRRRFTLISNLRFLPHSWK